MAMMDRRSFLQSILIAGMAPAIVRAESLMKVCASGFYEPMTLSEIVRDIAAQSGHGFHVGDIVTFSDVVSGFSLVRPFAITAATGVSRLAICEGPGRF